MANSDSWVVHKFGGSSVADAECFRRVADILVAQAANEPANRRLVMGDPLHHGHLTAGREDPNRDGVPVDVKAEVDRGEMRNTGHGRLLRMLAPSAKDG